MIVIPRSFSRSMLSMTRSMIRSFKRYVPLCFSIASTSVVLPWSTCAMIARLRMASAVLTSLSSPFSGHRAGGPQKGEATRRLASPGRAGFYYKLLRRDRGAECLKHRSDRVGERSAGAAREEETDRIVPRLGHLERSGVSGADELGIRHDLAVEGRRSTRVPDGDRDVDRLDRAVRQTRGAAGLLHGEANARRHDGRGRGIATRLGHGRGIAQIHERDRAVDGVVPTEVDPHELGQRAALRGDRAFRMPIVTPGSVFTLPDASGVLTREHVVVGEQVLGRSLQDHRADRPRRTLEVVARRGAALAG